MLMMPPSAPSRAAQTWTDRTSFKTFIPEMLLVSVHEVNRDVQEASMYHLYWLYLNLFFSRFNLYNHANLYPD